MSVRAQKHNALAKITAISTTECNVAQFQLCSICFNMHVHSCNGYKFEHVIEMYPPLCLETARS